MGDREKVQIAGFFYRNATDHAVTSSTGLRARHRETEAQYTVTARTLDATGSGWGGRELHRVADLDDAALSRTAIDKAVRSASPNRRSARPLRCGCFFSAIRRSA